MKISFNSRTNYRNCLTAGPSPLTCTKTGVLPPTVKKRKKKVVNQQGRKTKMYAVIPECWQTEKLPSCSAYPSSLSPSCGTALSSQLSYTEGRSLLVPSLFTTMLILCSPGGLGTSCRTCSVIYSEHSLTGRADYHSVNLDT